jgi:acyl-CoA reductase-like NAD-dependent aldehyde dehydrogenase
MGAGGQSCISVQRVYVHRDTCADWTTRISAAVDALHLADDVGPVIDERAAERIETWVAEAVDAGATCVRGGTRDGALVAPTVLTDVPQTARVLREEVFGPVLVLCPVDSEEEAFARINDSRFGLQAGLFTHDLRVVDSATRWLEVGGIVVGDVPSYRADQMPYGGVKDSGSGREGVRAAMDDLTEEKVVVLAVRR